jgi:hypothetical protein
MPRTSSKPVVTGIRTLIVVDIDKYELGYNSKIPQQRSVRTSLNLQRPLVGEKQCYERVYFPLDLTRPAGWRC